MSEKKNTEQGLIDLATVSYASGALSAVETQLEELSSSLNAVVGALSDEAWDAVESAAGLARRAAQKCHIAISGLNNEAGEISASIQGGGDDERDA